MKMMWRSTQALGRLWVLQSPMCDQAVLKLLGSDMLQKDLLQQGR
jgi:hypothetical protein